MRKGVRTTLAAAAVAGAAIVAAAASAAAAEDDDSETPRQPEPTHAPATSDPDYWTDERMRDASPAPMPTEPAD